MQTSLTIRFAFTALLACFFSFQASAQLTSRSGFPAPPSDGTALRQFPCAGITVMDERFDADTLPAGWAAIDYDNQVPRLEIQGLIGKGWESRVDFKNANNRVLASASWYEDTTVASDDYLILPKTLLDGNICFSWYAYSQDQFYPESYEVRISTTTPDSAGFMANPALAVVAAESYDINYRSINLSAYTGQEVYLAFRHTSFNQFILVIDDIRLAQINALDLAMLSFDIPTGNAGDDFEIRGAFRNAGSDTIKTDTGLFLGFQINGGDPKLYLRPDTVVLIANDSLQFLHDSIWTPANDAVYLLKVWVSAIAGDNNPLNDTLYFWVGIGTKTALDPEKFGRNIRLFPNPASDQVQIELPAADQLAEFSLLDIHGKVMQVPFETQASSTRVEVGQLPKGIYLLNIVNKKGERAVLRLVRD